METVEQIDDLSPAHTSVSHDIEPLKTYVPESIFNEHLDQHQMFRTETQTNLDLLFVKVAQQSDQVSTTVQTLLAESLDPVLKSLKNNITEQVT